MNARVEEHVPSPEELEYLNFLGEMEEETVESGYEVFDPLEKLKEDEENEKQITFDLKPLPPSLKYAFLELNQDYPVVISSSLKSDEEIQLLKMLSKHKSAIGWKISDIHGIDPSLCTHCIHLEEDVKPSQQL